jgi:hypothetical protein
MCRRLPTAGRRRSVALRALSGRLAASGEGRLSGGFISGTLGRSGGAVASRGGGGESPTKARDPTLPLPDSFDDALAAKGVQSVHVTTLARPHKRARTARCKSVHRGTRPFSIQLAFGLRGSFLLAYSFKPRAMCAAFVVRSPCCCAGAPAAQSGALSLGPTGLEPSGLGTTSPCTARRKARPWPRRPSTRVPFLPAAAAVRPAASTAGARRRPARPTAPARPARAARRCGHRRWRLMRGPRGGTHRRLFRPRPCLRGQGAQRRSLRARADQPGQAQRLQQPRHQGAAWRRVDEPFEAHGQLRRLQD